VARGTADLCVAAGALGGLAAAALVSGTAVLVGTAALALLTLYSPVLKARGLPGNLAVALIAGLPLEYGAIAVGHAAAGIVPWILASWIHLVREIVKDVDDQAGDRALGRRTLPLVLGARRATVIAAGLAAAFVPLSLALPAWAHYRGAYFLIALFAQLVVLAVASRLFAGRTQGNSRLLKGAMLVGIVALVAGRVA
jgi:4-hydroxybenzoate polyprenyltransferase